MFQFSLDYRKIVFTFVSLFSMKTFKIIPPHYIAIVPPVQLDSLCIGSGYF